MNFSLGLNLLKIKGRSSCWWILSSNWSCILSRNCWELQKLILLFSCLFLQRISSLNLMRQISGQIVRPQCYSTRQHWIAKNKFFLHPYADVSKWIAILNLTLRWGLSSNCISHAVHTIPIADQYGQQFLHILNPVAIFLWSHF